MSKQTATVGLHQSRVEWAEERKRGIKSTAEFTRNFWDDLVVAFRQYAEALNDNESYSAQLIVEQSKDALKLSLWNWVLDLAVDDFTNDIFYCFRSSHLLHFRPHHSDIWRYGSFSPGFYRTNFTPDLYFFDLNAEYQDQMRRKLTDLQFSELEDWPLPDRVARCLLELLLSGQGMCRSD
jgi:hypothetical protein